MATIVETSQDAIFYQSLDGIIMSWNPGAEKLYGYKAEEIVGRSATLLISPSPRPPAPATLRESGPMRGPPWPHVQP